ncbi:MAG: hypothetical protein WA057_06765 [Candidatus Magasanikiibacteriota bacterium]
MQDILEIHEFFVEGKKQERSHVLLHITEPGTPEEYKKGYFFAIAEINNGNLEQIEHLQQMIDDLESNYYEMDEEEGKDSFESSLEFINKRGHHILQYKDSVINCLVGVLRDHELSFAYHGTPHTILFYHDKNEDLQEINILAEDNANEPEHLFSSMMQGSINENDHFYVATPHVVDYFTDDRIKKILALKNTRQSAEHIQRVLKDLDSDVSFGGIFFHFPTKTQIPKTGRLPLGSEKGSADSLNKMIEHTRTTEEIMSPPIMSNITGTVKGFLAERKDIKAKKKLEKIQNQRQKNLEITQRGGVETNHRTREDQPDSNNLFNIVLIAIGRGIVNLVLWLYNLIKTIILFVGKALLSGFILITNHGGQREVIINEQKQKINFQKDKISSMPLSSKILLGITIIFALVFIASISYFKIRENYQASKQVYNNQVQAIVDKKVAADASIIYNDEGKAMTLLQEAKNAIAQLPTDSKAEKEKITELNNAVNETLMKLRKLTVVSPELIIDLKQTKPEANVQGLALIDNTLVAYGADDVNLYKINPSTKQAEAVIHNTIPHLLSADTPKENDKIVFITGKDSVANYNKESSTLSKLDITFPHDNTQMADIFIYNLRAYILDPVNKQVYRHNPTQTGYDKGADWIKDQADLSDAVSIAIDGDAFILKKNGEIYKYVSGNKADFNISGLDPKLDNPSQIWTYNGVNNIYVLEPTNKRVVVLDKTGKMLSQYTANEWQNPTGMIVKESEKTIYVLDSNKIYKFGI